MRKQKILFTILFLMPGMLLLAGTAKKETFKVYGVCGLCENRIETAAKTVEGVITAHWDQHTWLMELTFDASKTDVLKVEQAIADAGHDTEQVRATDEAYNNLPACCQYERPEANSK